MNCKDFNRKYIDYLEEGHYGLDIDYPEVIKYLDEVFQDLIKISGFKYFQIKLKFDQCRFYTNLNPKLNYAIEMMIDKIIKLNKIESLNSENL